MVLGQRQLAGAPRTANNTTGHEDWQWLVRQLHAAGNASVRASSDWQWVTFRRSDDDHEVRQIVRLPVDGLFTVTRYDSLSRTCEIMADAPTAKAALSVALS